MPRVGPLNPGRGLFQLQPVQLQQGPGSAALAAMGANVFAVPPEPFPGFLVFIVPPAEKQRQNHAAPGKQILLFPVDHGLFHVHFGGKRKRELL